MKYKNWVRAIVLALCAGLLICAAALAEGELTIVSYPKSVTVYEGEEARTSVKAKGDGLKYTWYYAPAGSSSYSKSSVTGSLYSFTMTPEKAGRKLICYVSDAYGNRVQCPTIAMKMAAPLRITSQPRNAGAFAGETATVSVKASGTGLSYSWYVANAGSSNFYKSSITGSSYSVAMNEARDGRRVYCVVKDVCGSTVKSEIVTLKLKRAVKIIEQPKSAKVFEGEIAMVKVKASGDGLKYTWYFKNAGASSYTKSSTTTSYYDVAMNASRDGRRLICYVSDAYGNRIQCNTVLIKMAVPLRITSQPKSVYAYQGKKAAVKLSAVGEGLTYSWYASDVGDNGVYYKSSTIKGNTYEVVMNDVRNGRKVYCVVKDEFGNSVKSDIATLKRAEALQITSHPSDVRVDMGDYATLSVRASGTGLKYAWYVKDIGDSAYVKSSINTSDYSVVMNAERDGRKAYCVVSDVLGSSVTSEVAVMSKRNHVQITQQPPESITVRNGETITVTVEATGDGLEYTWYAADRGDYRFSQLSLSGNTYTTIMNEDSVGRQVYCKVTDAYGDYQYSDIVTLNCSSPIGTHNTGYAQSVVDIVNQYREEYGLGSLRINSELMRACAVRAEELTISFSHTRPDGTSCFTVSDEAWAENIAYGYATPNAVMNGWMNSTGHRNNILGAGYQSMGVGCFRSYTGTTYWVQLFGY